MMDTSYSSTGEISSIAPLHPPPWYFYDDRDGIYSFSGHRVVSLPFYSATKFAVTAITEGLRQELRQMKSSIKVTVRVCSIY